MPACVLAARWTGCLSRQLKGRLMMPFCVFVQAISLSGETLMGKNPATVAAKMARVEKHIRNNSLQVRQHRSYFMCTR